MHSKLKVAVIPEWLCGAEFSPTALDSDMNKQYSFYGAKTQEFGGLYAKTMSLTITNSRTTFNFSTY